MRQMPFQNHHIEIRQSFKAPVETVFNLLSDHESFGKVLATNIKRVKDSPDENKNGVGSVRRIRSFPLPPFEETIVTFEPNALIEYVISKGSPIKDHKGRMQFSQKNGKTRLYYSIDFKPRLPFIFMGIFLKSAIEKPIRKSLKALSNVFEGDDSPR